jgi:hypothetical protein
MVAVSVLQTSAEIKGRLIVARIGTTGDGKAGKLGFGVAIPTFILEKQIPDIIKAAFRVARERDVAVHFSFDWGEYLARHFRHGARLVGVNVGASSPALEGQLTQSAYGPEAIAAYRAFFSGKL